MSFLVINYGEKDFKKIFPNGEFSESNYERWKQDLVDEYSMESFIYDKESFIQKNVLLGICFNRGKEKEKSLILDYLIKKNNIIKQDIETYKAYEKMSKDLGDNILQSGFKYYGTTNSSEEDIRKIASMGETLVNNLTYKYPNIDIRSLFKEINLYTNYEIGLIMFSAIKEAKTQIYNPYIAESNENIVDFYGIIGGIYERMYEYFKYIDFDKSIDKIFQKLNINIKMNQKMPIWNYWDTQLICFIGQNTTSPETLKKMYEEFSNEPKITRIIQQNQNTPQKIKDSIKNKTQIENAI